jgi:hypothetical protein
MSQQDDTATLPGLPLALPDMTLPFPATCHPDVDEIERDALAWAASRVGPAMLARLADTRAGRIVARTADPRAPRDLLDAYARFLVWGFWFDDEFVDDLPPDSPRHAPAIAAVLDILDTGRGTGEVVADALREVVAGLETVLLPEQFARWREETRMWFASMTFQNVMRAAHRTPAVQEYQTLRRYTVCSYPCIVLIDASHGPLVGWDDYHDAEMATLRRHAANVVAWQNDVFSYFVERGHPGQFWNLPTVHIAHGLQPHHALHRTARDTAAEVATFRGRVAAGWPDLSTAQRSHVDSLRSWMRGCHDWALEATGRYTGWLATGST